METKRISWEEYFVGIVNSIAKRGTCDRGQSGAIIVKDNQIISTGYVGSAAGDDHCDDVGHKYEYRVKPHWLDKTTTQLTNPQLSWYIKPIDYSQHCIRTIHAEQNAICAAAKHGHSINGATIYCSMTPCHSCCRMIINSGIIKVVALKEYQASALSKEIFKKCGVELIVLDPTLNKY